MTDKKFLETLKLVKKELIERYGKACKDRYAGCITCRVHILIAFLNELITLEEWEDKFDKRYPSVDRALKIVRKKAK